MFKILPLPRLSALILEKTLRILHILHILHTLLFFDTNYNNFEIGNIITLVSDSKYVNGYSLDDGVITAYNENKCDYYIEQMIYNMKKGTTKLKLISV